MTVAAYVGREVDLVSFRGLRERGAALLEQRIVTDADGGLVVAGIHKLVQRFLLVLFTRRGSLRFLPEAGCEFVEDMAAGGWRTAADVQQSFYSALLDVRRQLVADERAEDPDDERFAGATLTQVGITHDAVRLAFEIRSVAGDRYSFIQAVSVLPR